GEDLTVSCVHPGWPVLSGRGRGAPQLRADHGEHRVHPVLPDRRRVSMTGDTALVTCTENILSGGPAEEGASLGPLVGQLVVATNVFRRTPEGWKLWSHHGSPVLAETGEEEDEDTTS
ncbi:DUF4440 domain-containing protein, partial [Streptomyces sp. SID7803]|nr:DUF4440 domain-containing protein [Streptomyces sp. SID7803]